MAFIGRQVSFPDSTIIKRLEGVFTFKSIGLEKLTGFLQVWFVQQDFHSRLSKFWDGFGNVVSGKSLQSVFPCQEDSSKNDLANPNLDLRS